MSCDNSSLRHNHHIIPRYMGGTDDAENLVEVSVTQHAMFHFCNFQLLNNVEDYVAWRGLSGQISESDFLKEKFIIFGKIGSDRLQEKLKNNLDLKLKIQEKRLNSWNKNKEKYVEKLLKVQPKAVELASTPEARKKQKQKFKEIKHQQGEKNSQYGKMWITDGTKEGSYRINKGESIPKGFRPGRISKNENNIDYVYVITAPNGNIVKTKYLIDFCKRNNLSETNMYQIITGKKKYHKGYTVIRENLLLHLTNPPISSNI